MSDLEKLLSNESLPLDSYLAKNRAKEDFTAREDRKIARSAEYHAQFIKIVLLVEEKGLKNRFQYPDSTFSLYPDDPKRGRIIKGPNVPIVESIDLDEYYPK